MYKMLHTAVLHTAEADLNQLQRVCLRFKCNAVQMNGTF